ncbi:g6927 [Coccomyxa elongata]
MQTITAFTTTVPQTRRIVKASASRSVNPVKAVNGVQQAQPSLKKSLVGAGVGVLLAAQFALLPAAHAGPDLPFGLNNPFGDDIQETRDASKMPANRSEIGSAAADAKSNQAQNLSANVAKASGRAGEQPKPGNVDITQGADSSTPNTYNKGAGLQ